MQEPSLAAKLGAEFLGTFLLVFMGCGAAILAATFLTDDGVQLGIGFLGVSLAFGLSLVIGVYAFGHVSGGHFNPAVTIGLAIAKRFEWKGVLPYIVTQIVAASVAGAVLFAIANGKPGFNAVESGFASNGYGDRSPGGYGLVAALIIEIVITAVFVYVILGATDDRATKGLAPIAIASAGADGEALQNCGSEADLASPAVTNGPDLSGLRVGPGPIKYSAEGGTRTLTPEGTGT
jgi:aquaporin Z